MWEILNQRFGHLWWLQSRVSSNILLPSIQHEVTSGRNKMHCELFMVRSTLIAAPTLFHLQLAEKGHWLFLCLAAEQRHGGCEVQTDVSTSTNEAVRSIKVTLMFTQQRWWLSVAALHRVLRCSAAVSDSERRAGTCDGIISEDRRERGPISGAAGRK